MSSSAAPSFPWPSSSNSPLPDSPLPILTSVSDFRAWRQNARRREESVGFVPTMGALHAGHIDLVRASLAENDHTVVSIFVNPAQFAPTEDLSSYPRTLPSDVQALHALGGSTPGVSAVFAPAVSEMYPSGLTQDVSAQVGAFVELAGLSHQMEGGSRPSFFRGVATVVTKLFHIVEPTRAYFGQKDIQQALLIRRLVSDLLFAHPYGADSVRVLPTTRAPDGLALSSRNAYLSPAARSIAPLLHAALQAGVVAWHSRGSDAERIARTLSAARSFLLSQEPRAREAGVRLHLDYIALNDPATLADLERTTAPDLAHGAVLSGAALVSDLHPEDARVTRLIDNVLLGFEL